MQYIIILAVILVLLVVLGVSIQLIANVSAWVIMLLCTVVSFAMLVFFIYFFSKLVTGKKTSGRFLRADFKQNGSFKKYRSAVYDIDGAEYFNIFPFDLKLFYKKDKNTELYIDKKGNVYDTLTRITIFSGVILSAVMTVLLTLLTVYFYNTK